jgi:hypothetical protein
MVSNPDKTLTKKKGSPLVEVRLRYNLDILILLMIIATMYPKFRHDQDL